MSLLKQDLFLEQPYRYCTYLGRIQAPHNGLFSTDEHGFRVSFNGTEQISLDFFNSVDSSKVVVLGNSVSYGVAVPDDKLVFHNLCNLLHSKICFNISMRASTTFQDWICLGRTIFPREEVKIFWVAGLNDLIAVLLGEFSHQLFPPWFGELSIKANSKWSPIEHSAGISEKLSLLSDSISTLILNASAMYNVCFIWQPLYSRKASLRELTDAELQNIDNFFKQNTGGLSALYRSDLLSSCYESLINMVQLKVSSSRSGSKTVKFIDSNQILPSGTLSDVTHLNALGHSCLASLLHRYLS